MTPPLLTDTLSVREYLEADDAYPDELIDTLIEQASDAIPRYCEREFGDTKSVTRRFEFLSDECYNRRSRIVDVCPFELRTVSAVRIDPEVSGGTLLAESAYRLWPLPSRDGTFYGLRLAALGLPGRPAQSREFPQRQIEISGDWGFAVVPPQIKKFANETVESWLRMRKDQGFGLNVVEREGEPVMRPDDLPSSVRFGLKAAWMRPILPR